RHVNLAPELVGPRDKAGKQVNVVFVYELRPRAIFCLEHSHKLFLIEPAVERRAVRRLVIQRREDAFFGIHSSVSTGVRLSSELHVSMSRPLTYSLCHCSRYTWSHKGTTDLISSGKLLMISA